ncbi:MAG: trypsin-like peptidase domain-containing protein [Acidobacteria bacterium]|nr:trypsin-like peptidase domain-containing protein [Acidobacteriota bacterium]
MSTPRVILSLALIALGFAAGLVISGRTPSFSAGSPPPANADSTQAIAGVPTAATDETLAGGAASRPRLPDTAPPDATSQDPGVEQTRFSGMLPDFSRVAELTVPAVVNISAQQVVRRQDSPFANDPFFQFFYGNRDDVFGSRRRVERSLGSGVIVSADGLVLTNNHVVAGESGRLSRAQLPSVSVALADNRELDATIVGVDPATDLALLRIDAGTLPTIPWGDSDQLKVAEWVMAIGNPFQLSQTVTLGIVSALGRNNVGISAYEDFIQTDAAINPGNSGGALVNTRGELVGINTAIFSQSGGYQGIGFAVPSNLARRIVSDLNQYGEVRRGSIGYVEIAPVSTFVADELGVPNAGGVLIQAMRRDTAAYRAGLRPGDVIVAFNGIAVVDSGQLSRQIQDATIGSTATVAVIRAGQRIELEIEIQGSVQ